MVIEAIASRQGSKISRPEHIGTGAGWIDLVQLERLATMPANPSYSSDFALLAREGD